MKKNKREKKVDLKALSLLFAMLLSSSSTVISASTANKIVGQVFIENGSINLKEAPSADSKEIGTLYNSQFISLVEKQGDFYKVQTGQDSFGFIDQSYVSTYESTIDVVKTRSGLLNVRGGPSTGYEVTDKIPSGTPVTIVFATDEWRFIHYGEGSGKYGYVHQDYLEQTTLLAPMTSHTSDIAPNYQNTAVQLEVPYYSQLDYRWKRISLGMYGENIAQIGCTVTSLAMMQSYLTGKTILPSEIAYTHKFTPGGALHWKEGFVSNFTNDYLSFIAEELHNGRPVLFAAKKHNGTAHWVVVTGYNGRGLQAENFTINDPAERSRNTLQALLKDYPVYFKLVSFVQN